MNSMYIAADNKNAMTLVGLDISAGFDTIDHGTLLSRLDSLDKLEQHMSRVILLLFF